MTELEKAFYQYEDIATQLRKKTFEYLDLFEEIDTKEIILQEEYSPEELEKINKQIDSLEEDINSLYTKFLNHTNIILTLLRKENIYNFNIINRVNHEHISTMMEYNTVVSVFNRLKKTYKDYDFDKVIDFSKMEKQKQKLNIQIKKFNEKFLKDLNIRLLSVYDCEAEARQEFLKIKD